MKAKRRIWSVTALLGLLIASAFLIEVATAASGFSQIQVFNGMLSLHDGLATQTHEISPDSQFSSAKIRNWNYRSSISKLVQTPANDQDFTEIMIGIDDSEPNSCDKIEDLVAKRNGDSLNVVSIKGKTKAIVLKVPSKEVSSLLLEIERSGLSSYVEPRMKFRASQIPNDAEWLRQWALRKTRVDYAWNTTTGRPSVVIAIVDTGVDWNHPDLANNIWNNTDEWLDGRDNDGNGFVDDIRGWDFVDTTDAISPGEDGTARDNDPMDFHGHGTHCAGIAAAVGNNNLGIAGVTWNSKIMPVRAGYMGADGNGYLENDDAAQAIIYAVDNGADVISMSWGAYEMSKLLYEAVKYAYDAGVLLVAAAGNDATSLESYPAAHEEVIAVSATQQDDTPAWWTNFGSWIGVAAPGVDIYSTVYDDSYAVMDGTSMSTPLVAGIAALILSRFPGMTRDQLRAQLQFTADDLGEPGFDAQYGFGRVNAQRAVESIPSTHDILILKLKASSIVRPGDLAVIDTTVLNMGMSQETNVDVLLMINGVVANSTVISMLSPGESVSIRFLWNTASVTEGVYNATVYVVPVKGEVANGNNAWSTSIWVRAPQVIRVPDEYNTIQDAVDAAVEGDTVFVASGTYFEHVQITKNDLKLIGEEEGNTIIDGGRESDVILVASDNVEVKGFTIRGSSRDLSYQPPFSGILVFRSKNSIIMETKTLENLAGIFIFRSTGITLRDNSMSGNMYNFGVDGYTLTDFIHNIDTSNTVDGKSICYWVSQRNKAAPPNSGCVVAVNSTNVVARNLSLTKNYAGALFAFTANSLVENVNVSDNYIGIWIFHSSFNAIYGSRLSKNDVNAYLHNSQANYFSHNTIASGSYGFRLYNSANNKLNFNEVTSNSRGIFVQGSDQNTILGSKFKKNTIGVWLYRSDNNTVENNEATYSVGAIMLTESQYNIICRNDVADNYLVMGTPSYGIWLEWSSNNAIYLNNFVNNQFHVGSVESVNTWDKGYPSGGNYWSGYDGIDANDDGIGDTPLIIDGGNKDNYPLVVPYTRPQIVLMHDAAIVEVLQSATEIYVGQTLEIAVTASNEGNVTETFPITIKHELEGINYTDQTQIVDILAPGANATLSFTWTAKDPGVHLIRAEVPPIENETDTQDNTKASSISLKVKILGDINNDDCVDIRDIAITALAFGTHPDHTRWNAQADMNFDGKVDIRDLAIVAKNFGKRYP